MPFDSMPFDPQLIHPDEPPLRPDGELDLPEDLAALAEQLKDDAAHLAARFPADRAPPAAALSAAALSAAALSAAALSAELVEAAERIKSRARSRGSLALGLTIAGAGLASVAVLGLTIWLGWQHNDSLPSAVDTAQSTPAVPTLGERMDRLPAISGAAASRSPAALSVGELSGPELEGLFDLLDEEPPSVASISF